MWNERCGEIQLYTTVLCQPSEASTVEREVWGDPAVYNSALSAVRSLHCGEIQLYTTVLCQPSEASTVER